MNQDERRAGILERAAREGTVRIGALAEALGVSLETVRRDIRPLVESGHLAKRHGSVSLAEAPFERRLRERAAEKRRIGRKVAQMIEDGDSLMLDTGTTTSLLARELLGKRALTVVTNSTDIARTLGRVAGNRIFLAGGEVFGDNGATFGAAALDFVSGFKVRYAIVSIAAVDAEGALLDHQPREAEFARRVLACGRRRLVVTDHSKFGRGELARVAELAEIDLLVTDRAPPAGYAALFAAAGTELAVAD